MKENWFQYLPDIIKAASASIWGVLSLMVIVIAAVAIYLFRKSGDAVKIPIFGFLFLGVAAFAIACFNSKKSIDTGQQSEKSLPQPINQESHGPCSPNVAGSTGTITVGGDQCGATVESKPNSPKTKQRVLPKSNQQVGERQKR